MKSVSERFRQIDKAAMDELGPITVASIMTGIRDRSMSLREVAAKNNTTTGTIVQVARFHKIDSVTLESIE